MNPTALIAEDEPLLAQALAAELASAWPELRIAATVADGLSAVAQALAHLPDVLFFDIRMPGLGGLQAVAELADAWPLQGAGGKPFPLLVFVTAYDAHAIEAFEAQASDYLLKPVQAARLRKTVEKLQLALGQRAKAAMHSGAATMPHTDAQLQHTLSSLRALLSSGAPAVAPSPAPLQMLAASLAGSNGNHLRMVPVADVLYFEAADKYIRVITASAEYLIRTPLRELLAQLDAATFWQVHRGTLVRASAIDTVSRDENGRLTLALRGQAGKLAVSRLYAHLFKAS